MHIQLSQREKTLQISSDTQTSKNDKNNKKEN